MGKGLNGPLAGAAFLMATAAIGPGFLNNTAVYTSHLGAAFGFVILLSMLIDIGAQWNIWRIVTDAGTPAQDLANAKLYGSGHLLAGMISFGGWVFNIGNLAGCGLGLELLTGLPMVYGAALSGAIAFFILNSREAGVQMDRFVKWLGIMMIGLTSYVAIVSDPPMRQVAIQMVWPDRIDWEAVMVLVGGTVGGYISFAGAQRLLDAGMSGKENRHAVSRSAVQGILLTSIMRFILFLAAFGVVAGGVELGKGNPAASVFQSAAGTFGYYFFGVVLWSAGITSVVGATYTSVSFWRSLSQTVRRRESLIRAGFIFFSLLVFIGLGNPPQLLLLAGAINGLILPLALGILLMSVAVPKPGESVRAFTLYALGWLVVVLMAGMSGKTLQSFIDRLSI